MPGTIFLGDLQTDWIRLPQCEQLLDQVEEFAKEKQVEALVFLGDLKDRYNPVDIRVVRFLVHRIHQLICGGFRVMVLLGNHDRVGMADSSGSWLSVLEKVGAEVYDVPGVASLSNLDVGFLPYRQSATQIRKDIEELTLLRQENSSLLPLLLCFHFGLKEAYYRPGARAEDADISVAELSVIPYTVAIGGHFHMVQKVTGPDERPVYYLGTPYTVDWGEVNQTKGFLFCQRRPGCGMTYDFVTSCVPLWLDPGDDGFKPQTHYTGCRIRIKVPIPPGTINYDTLVNQSVAEARAKYPGSLIVPEPQFPEEKDKDLGNLSLRARIEDKELIKEFVGETLPRALRERQKTITDLIFRFLERHKTNTGEHRRVHLTSVEATNVLSFEHVFLRLDRSGVVLVSGENKDWGGGSNGSGKTSLLQLARVALFGSTTKGQSANGWMRNGEETAEVRLQGLLENGQEWVVVRSRPNALQFSLAGVDQSSGQGRAKTGISTQEEIEQTTGLTRRVFDHSVLIDQKLLQTANSFLQGTDKERKEILDEFLGTERFRLAERDARDVRLALNEQETFLQARIAAQSESLSNLRNFLKENEGKGEEVVKMAELRASLPSLQTAAAQLVKAETLLEKVRREIAIHQSRLLMGKAWLRSFFSKFSSLKDKKELSTVTGTCGYCKQPLATEDSRKNLESALEAEFQNLKQENKKYKQMVAEETSVLTSFVGKEKKLSAYCLQHQGAKLKLQNANVALAEEKAWAMVEAARAHISREEVESFLLAEEAEELKVRMAVGDYVVEALGRKGIVQTLYLQVCAFLNLASDRYSRLLTDGVIRLRFAVEQDGSFNVSVFNTVGGRGAADQSRGEEQLAALIAVLCLREIGPRSNLIILDEPAEGLDFENARRLAVGLVELATEIPTVFLATHNDHLKAFFAGANEICITKQGKVSEIKC